jgi:threonine synthase
MLGKVGQGFEELRVRGLVDGRAPRLVGAQAAGCSPVADAFADDRPVRPVRPSSEVRSLAIGNPADGEFAIGAARRSGGAIYSVDEDEVGGNMHLLASTSGVFGEAAAGVTLGAAKRAVQQGVLGPADRVVLVVTGDGLKTPGPVRELLEPVEIEADADAVLDLVGAAV